MNKDGTFTHIHLTRARDADLFEDFYRDRLPADEIYVPPQHAPINPEDEDDVVPDQHAAFGIQKALMTTAGGQQRGGASGARGAGGPPAWKDLGLGELMKRGPPLMTGKGGMGMGGKGGTSARGKLPR
ncbi:Apc13p protein-domain-containing protein [Pseudomassariella vexata]|uniref:Apc13p protein-domain-containing protein n=1 Tax=Pseudomassariella vexata TaxID=1141098 RepID=A0A1Y2EK57_9PEZI|nr:Apc13p protein-domain-containing protein [Pseudomassariella vexata]ORY71943.1 Apc13p protein-domain-containing protein [Pseudomassariella vexata]